MSRQSQNLRDAIVESVTFLDLADPPRWKGRLQLSGEHHPIDILIFNIDGEFQVVPALCSHEGYDLTHCPLLNGNTPCLSGAQPTHRFEDFRTPCQGTRWSISGIPE